MLDYSFKQPYRGNISNKKSPKPNKPLPSWIVVSAKDPKLQEAIEKKLAEKLAEPEEKKEEQK